MTEPVWIPCQEPGCPNGIAVHWRHADNFADRYYCPQHPEGAQEVPC